jgi:hypothetical protein
MRLAGLAERLLALKGLCFMELFIIVTKRAVTGQSTVIILFWTDR